MSDVTRLIEAAQAGDRKAAAELLPVVYYELRKLAAARLANEKPGHTLQGTALVHEAYLRLIGDQHFNGRVHFFGAAAAATLTPGLRCRIPSRSGRVDDGSDRRRRLARKKTDLFFC